MQIAQPGMNMDQDRQMLMVEDNVGNQFRPKSKQKHGDRKLLLHGTGHEGKQDAAYLQKQMQIAQKEEAGIQLTSEEFDFMRRRSAYSDKAHVYALDGVSRGTSFLKIVYNIDIFSMFTQEEHVEQSGGTVEQHPANIEETRAYFESLYNNLATEV
ncbi:hypothetical protein Tco_0654907 [Tanacetum coccineum]|uniref:Uncharacterized protein n=1 Tax=Tanacetum coccineum TaxID=301880 RepID=A0ABQ4X500_9ASTR